MTQTVTYPFSTSSKAEKYKKNKNLNKEEIINILV